MGSTAWSVGSARSAAVACRQIGSFGDAPPVGSGGLAVAIGGSGFTPPCWRFGDGGGKVGSFQCPNQGNITPPC
ncbi:MAG: hypothetical protein OXF68_09425 [Gammaproteobacteria bacterium]|nr:hypothetical protein [Gammaproteobacteria bacterium]